MSYDRIYVCRELDQSTWMEQRQMEKQGRSEEFEAESDYLYQKGDFVELVAGGNFMFGELYLFVKPEDANRFYEVDFAGRESIVDDKPCGFQEVSLYRSGKLIATKSQQPLDDPQVVIGLEQSKEEVPSADTAFEGDGSDLLEAE